MGEEKKGGIEGKDAFELFPDIMKKAPAKATGAKREASPGPGGSASAQPSAGGKAPAPPGPPDISWLWKGEFENAASISEMPTTMLLMPEGGEKTVVQQTFEDIGYLVESASSEQEAIDRMELVNLAAVVLQTDALSGPLEKSILHNYMKWLPMTKRRKIYYVLIGPDFRTMYNLEALSLSANLVVNNRDVNKLEFILRKGLQEYEDLFGPLLASMQEHGRR